MNSSETSILGLDGLISILILSIYRIYNFLSTAKLNVKIKNFKKCGFRIFKGLMSEESEGMHIEVGNLFDYGL